MSTNNITNDIADSTSPPSYTNANVPTLNMNGTLSNLTNLSTTTLTVNGVNIDSSEIGYLDGVSQGVASASKAVVLDSLKGISGVASLSLNGAGDIVSIQNTSPSGRGTLLLQNDNRGYELGIRGSSLSPPDSFYIWDKASSTFRFVINSTGNVGLGIDFAQYKLHVVGDINASSSYNLNGVSMFASALTGVSDTSGAVASKALVLDSSKSITGIASLTSSSLTGGTINATSAYNLNGVSIFASALTGVSDTSGAVASKALVLDSSKSITGITSMTSSSLIVSGTTISGSSTTGALTVAGGVGIKGSINGGGNSIDFTATARSESLLNFTDTNTVFNNAFSASDTTPRYTYYFGAPTYTGTTSRTTTLASTMYISGSPISGTNNAITNSYALVVNSGRSSFGGASSYSTTAGSEQVITIPALTLTASSIATPDSTHRSIFVLNAPTMTSSTTLITTNASTMYIAGPPASAGSMTLTNSYSMYVNSGQSYLGGNVIGKSWIGIFPSTNPIIDTTRLVQAIDSAQATTTTRSITLGRAYSSLDSAGLVYSWTGTASTSNYVSLGLYGSSAYNNTLVVHGSGNVGIGTTSPSYNLDITGTTRITGALTVSGTGSHSIAGTLTATLASGAQTGITSVGTLSALSITGDVSISTGKLTIGTGNDITSTIAGYIKGVVLGSATASTIVALDASKNYSGINSLSSNELNLGGTAISYTSASTIGSESINTIAATTLTNTSVTGTDATHRSALYIKQPTLNASVAITTTTSSSVFIDGPPLTSGTASITNRYALYAAGPMYTRGVSTFVSGSYTKAHQWSNDNASPISVELQIFNGTNGTAANNATFGTTSGNFLSLMTNGTQRMTFDISGNVGINTATPSFTLDVSGTTRITGASTIAGILSLTAGTTSTSTTTGSLVVTGGVGISGATYIGGTLNAAGITSLTSNTTSTSTTTGSLVVTGGVGISGATYIGGALNVSGATTQGTTTISGITTISNATASTNTTTGAVVITGGSGIGGALNVAGATALSSTLSVSGITTITNATAATNATTGALVITGGVGISGTSFVAGALNVSNSTASTTTTTGALVITGGVGIGGALNVGGGLSTTTLSASGNATITGTLSANNVGTNTIAGTLASTNTTVSGVLTVSGTGTHSVGGTLAAATLTVSGNTTMTGTLTANNTGTNTIAGTLASTNTTVSGVLTVSGTGTHSVSGTLSAATLTASGNTTITGTLTANNVGTNTIAGTLAASTLTVSGNTTMTGTLTANNVGTNTIAGTLASTNTTVSGVLTVSGTGTHSVSGTLSAATLTTSGIITANNTLNTGSSRSYTTVGTERALAVPTFTYTNNTTAASGTDANHRSSVYIAAQTIAATNTSVVTTNASTVYIDNAPTAGTNMTLTNRYAMYVAAGNTYLGGNANVTGTFGATGATTLGSTLSVSGATTLSGTLSVTGAITGTLQTAAQTNITSVGTLSTLSVSGATTIGGTLAVTGAITGTLQTATQTNITSVGTLSSLSVSGATTLTSITDSTSTTTGAVQITGGVGIAKTLWVGTGINGTLQTAAQTNITSVGTLSSLSVSGATTIGGTLSVTGAITGTLQTAAQTNITSVGTLSSLSVSGATTIGGTLSVTGAITGTLQTAAQTNITSVGTLSSLSVSGTTALSSTTDSTSTTTGAVQITGGVGIAKTLWVGTGINGTLQTAAQPNITSLGALTGLTVGSTSFTESKLAVLDSVTAGTALASKALVLDSSSNIVGINTLRTSILQVGTSTDTTRMISCLDSTTSAAATKYITIGKAASTNNLAEIGYYHAGDGLSTNQLRLGRYGTPMMVLQFDGNVGINTTSPAYKLDVSGTLNCSTLYIGGTLFNASGVPTYCSGVTTTGTAYGDKVVTLDSTLSVSGIATLGATTLNATNYQVGGVAANVGALTGITAGTALASKAVILDSSSNIAGINNIDANILMLGTSTDSTRMLSCLDSTMTNSSARYITLGKANSGNNQAEISYLHVGDGLTTNQLRLGRYGGRLMVLQFDGTVGIGTESPSCRLDLGSTSADRILALYNNGIDYYGFGAISNNVSYQAKTGHRMYVGSTPTDPGSEVFYASAATSYVYATAGFTVYNQGVYCDTKTAAARFYGNWAQVNYWGIGPHTTSAVNQVRIAQCDISGVWQSAYVSIYAGAYTNASDYRLKHNISTVPYGLNEILLLNPVKYDLINQPEDGPQIGFIAHEVQEVIPEVVSGKKDAMNEDGTEQHQGVAYSNIIPVLVKAIQEQQSTIEELQSQLATVLNELADIKSKL
jgi:fibronectin-binding autotransporter adhesin